MVLSVQPFLEPRGFIRALEFVFAIAAFATVSNFDGSIGFDAACTSSSPFQPITLTIPYPFHMGAHSETKNVSCSSGPPPTSKNIKFKFYGDFSSDAQFFVATGVLSMLWAMITVAVYLFKDQEYRLTKPLKFADFGATLLLATFWIAGSAAWANGLSGLKNITNPDAYIHNQAFWDDPSVTLKNPRGGNLAPLTISVLLGFLNFIMWAGNTWFLYKDIKDEHFSSDNSPQQQSVPPATSP